MAGDLRVRITAKDEARAIYRKHAQELKGLEGAMKQAAKTADSVAQSFAAIGMRMTLGITLPVVGIVGALTKMAMTAQESENLFEVSMGGMADSARRWSEQLRDQLGLNAREVRENVAVFQSMFTGMQIGEDVSYGLSRGLTQLAYDLSSFYNLDHDTAFEKIRSGIMGQTQPLRQLGIIVNETTTQQWALNQGLITQGQELSEQQKVLARYGVIMEATANAQGDLERTADSATNQWRRMQSTIKELGEEIGQEFLPITANALQWINNTGLPAVRGALTLTKESWDEMGETGQKRILIIAALLVAGGPLLLAISAAIKGVGLLAAAFTALKVTAVGGLVVVAAKAVAIGSILAFALEGVGKAVAAIGGALGAIGRELAKAPPEWGWYGAAEALQGIERAASGVGSALQVPMQFARDLADDLVDFAQDPMATFNALADQVEGLGRNQLQGLNAEIEKWAEIGRSSTKSVAGEIDGLEDPLANIKELWDQLGNAAEGAGAKAAGAAKDVAKDTAKAALSVNEMVSALIATHPAVAAASQQAAIWRQRIADVNLALIANRDQMRAAQAEYARMSEALSNMQAGLSRLQSRLAELSRPKLIGMGELGMQISAIESQLKRIQYAELTGMSMSQVMRLFPLLEQGAEQFLRRMPQTTEELELMLRQLRLTGELKFDEKLRLLGEAAQGAVEEMDFDAAMKELVETRREIGNLTGAITHQEAMMRSQQNAIRGLQEASEALNNTLSLYQDELKGAEQNLADVTEGLKLAFTWLLQDREKLQEMGGEAVAQSRNVDSATRTLLQSIDQYTQDVANGVSGTLNGIVAAYQRAVDEAKAIVASMPSMPSTVGVMGTADVPGFATGGSFTVGGASGVDRNLVAFRATRGEQVTVTPAGQSSGHSVTVQIYGPIYGMDDFEDAVLSALQTADRRGRV